MRYYKRKNRHIGYEASRLKMSLNGIEGKMQGSIALKVEMFRQLKILSVKEIHFWYKISQWKQDANAEN